MIFRHIYNGKVYELLPSDYNVEDSSFTVVVGKNGSGKSRLFSSIVKKINKNNNDLGGSSGGVVNVIAVSVSPFDKFPLYLKSSKSDYHYLGIRRISSRSVGNEYLSKCLLSLLDLYLAGNGFESVTNALSKLDISGSLSFRISLGLDFQMFSNTINHVGKQGMPDRERLSLYRNLLINMGFPHDLKISNVKEILDVFVDAACLGERNISFDFSGSYGDGDKFSEREVYVLRLLNGYGMLYASELRFNKNGKSHKFNDASSGEQSVLMSILGIASRIKDNSVILIDEPEVCLHPEWQERYIETLMDVFRDYRGCQFIIATHSPMIVSRLEEKRCFVFDIESRRLFDAGEFNNRSSDFQLASVFKYPGFKNEYLTRELLLIISRFSKHGRLESDDLGRARHFLKLKGSLREGDPVLQLLSILGEVLDGVKNGGL